MKWLTRRVPKESALIGCLYAGGATGVLYGFSVYSEALKSPPLSLTDPEVLRIGTMPFALGVTSPLWGYAADKLGPSITFICGCIVTVTAQMLEYLIATQMLSVGAVPWSLMACTCTSYIGTSLVTAQYATLPVKHYQQRRGEATALVKSFVGLTGAAVAQLFFLLYPGVDKTSTTCFNVIIMWISLAVLTCIIGSLLSSGQICHEPWQESRARLSILWYLLFCWGITTSLVSCTSLVSGLDLTHRVLAGILVVLLLVPAALWIFWNKNGQQATCARPLVLRDRPSFESPPKTILQMLSSCEAWLNFIAFCAVSGGGLIINTSMSQIFTAAGNSSEHALLLGQTLFATGNMLGRLTCMAPSDALVQRGIPRPCFMMIILGTMVISHSLYLLLPACSGSASIIAAATFLAGSAFGALYPHMVILTSELFGSAHLATNYMFYDGVVACVGSLIFAQFLTAGVEHSHTKQGDPDCIGAACFRNTHLVVLFSSLLGLFCTSLVALRSRALYRQISNAVLMANAAARQTSPVAAKDNGTCRT